MPDAASTVRFVEAGWGRDASTGASSSTVVLRWRSRKPVAAFQDAGSSARRQSARWRNADASSGSNVRLISHDGLVDPFDDPFGDSLAQQSQSESALPKYDPPKSDPNSVFEPPADLPSPSTEMDIPLGQPDRLEPQAPAPPLKMSAPSVGPPAPAAEGEAKVGSAPCKRIYNERDCCEEDEKCRTARQALRRNSIQNISLDITASFKPDADTLQEERQAREDQLRLMPARDWRNREGQKVAHGRLTGLRRRRAEITDTEGNTVAIPLGELSDDDQCFLAAWWGVPTECTLGDDKFAGRTWTPVTFAWKASALCHKPLYFEEVQLERYGHTTGPVFQPAMSGAHFFLNIATLPYKMGINPPNECQYALGYYRPGSCAPWLLPPVPVSARGGLYQAGAITGLMLLFP
jgi:hypothetical protein